MLIIIEHNELQPVRQSFLPTVKKDVGLQITGGPLANSLKSFLPPSLGSPWLVLELHGDIARSDWSHLFLAATERIG
jgi:hypothetical protein